MDDRTVRWMARPSDCCNEAFLFGYHDCLDVDSTGTGTCNLRVSAVRPLDQLLRYRRYMLFTIHVIHCDVPDSDLLFKDRQTAIIHYFMMVPIIRNAPQSSRQAPVSIP